MAHLRPLEDSEIDDPFIVERFAHYAETRGFTPNSIRTMARRPEIVKAFMALNQAILYEGTVSEQLKMLISLASSFAAGCLYCQSHMTNLSHIYDAPDEKITQILEFETSEYFSDAEKAALNLAFRAAQTPNQAEQGDFDRLGKYFSESEIVEIVASIGLFGFLNRWNDTMATSLEPLPAERAERILSDHDWSAGKHVAG
ncbi:carboxymuconolactone decarboxylase family protein [Parasphingorhabdus sp.]|uniref:carboxymuconolactone decarboxylase family protein n=1 Tax=Parasphingorhabdus sp. TaxID=2709688 RepID=UPI00326365C6